MSEKGKFVPQEVSNPSSHKCEDPKFHNAVQIFVAAASFEATIRASLGQDIEHYADVVAEQFPQLEVIRRGARRPRQRPLDKPTK